MTHETFEESPEFFTALIDWATNNDDVINRFETTDAYRRAHDEWSQIHSASDTLDRLQRLRERAG